MKKIAWVMIVVMGLLMFTACTQADEKTKPTEQSSQTKNRSEQEQLAAEYPETLLAWIYQNEAFSFDYEEFTVNQYNDFVSTENNVRGNYIYDPQQPAAAHVTYELESIAGKISDKIDRKEVIKDGTFQAIAVPNKEVVFTADEQLTSSCWHRVAVMKYLALDGFKRTNGGKERLPNELEVRYIQYENSEGRVIKLYLDDTPQLYGVGVSTIDTPEENHQLYIISNPSQDIPAEMFETDEYSEK